VEGGAPLVVFTPLHLLRRLATDGDGRGGSGGDGEGSGFTHVVVDEAHVQTAELELLLLLLRKLMHRDPARGGGLPEGGPGTACGASPGSGGSASEFWVHRNVPWRSSRRTKATFKRDQWYRSTGKGPIPMLLVYRQDDGINA